MSSSASQPNQPAPFLRKTYELVGEASTNHIISWSAQGLSFVVWKSEEFARVLLPQYFKHNNFSSFVRQLNTYGFRKVDPDRWEFANEGFVQGKKELLGLIQRRKASGPARPTSGSGTTTLTDLARSPPREYAGLPVTASVLPPVPPLDLDSSRLLQPMADTSALMENVQSLAVKAKHTDSSELWSQYSHIGTTGRSAFSRLVKRDSSGQLINPVEGMGVSKSGQGQDITMLLSFPQSCSDPATTNTPSSSEPSQAADDEGLPAKRLRSDGCAQESQSAVGTGAVAKPAPSRMHGVARPVPNNTHLTAHALFSEMAGQLGRISQLADEVADLRHENDVLRRNMMKLGHVWAQSDPSTPGDSVVGTDDVPQAAAGQSSGDANGAQQAGEDGARVDNNSNSSGQNMEEVVRWGNGGLEARICDQEEAQVEQAKHNAHLEARIAQLERRLKGRFPNQPDDVATESQESLLQCAENKVWGVVQQILQNATDPEEATRMVLHRATARTEKQPASTSDLGSSKSLTVPASLPHTQKSNEVADRSPLLVVSGEEGNSMMELPGWEGASGASGCSSGGPPPAGNSAGGRQMLGS